MKIYFTKLILIIPFFLIINNVYSNESDIAQLEEKALAGNQESIFKLADMYATGNGVKRNDHIAVFWFTKAILQHSKRARIEILNKYDLKFVLAADDIALFEGPGGSAFEINISNIEIQNKKVTPYKMR